jgi:uncharacterized membrane protein
MADLDNIVVGTFPERSKAFEALSAVRQAGKDDRVDIKQIALVERTKDGRIQVPEGGDRYEDMGLASGSLIGMLVGVLGGPVGLLLGWGAGALMGGTFDVDRETTSDSAVAELGRLLPPGGIAIIIDCSEVAHEVLDGEIGRLGGTVVRRPTSEVVAEIEAAEDAAKAASDQANRVLRDQRRTERKGKIQERVAALKTKLHIGDDAGRHT